VRGAAPAPPPPRLVVGDIDERQPGAESLGRLLAAPEVAGPDIACGQIDIGNAATDLTGWIAAGAMQADGSIRPEPVIDVELVARAVVHMAGLPLEANVQFMTLMATKMPFIGRG